MFYATLDAEGDRISQNAYIAAFATREEAVAYLMGGYDASEWNHDTAEIGVGRYGDCWIRVNSEPRTEDGQLVAGLCDFAPFTADQLYVTVPGQHPGGRAWWVEPRADVLVVERIDERGE